MIRDSEKRQGSEKELGTGYGTGMGRIGGGTERESMVGGKQQLGGLN